MARTLRPCCRAIRQAHFDGILRRRRAQPTEDLHRRGAIRRLARRSLIVAVVFWIFMVKWFQVDLLGAIILVVLSMVIRWAMLATIFSLT